MSPDKDLTANDRPNNQEWRAQCVAIVSLGAWRFAPAVRPAGAALEGGKVWLERPQCKTQADARARALIELEMLLNFWGAAADGEPQGRRVL